MVEVREKYKSRWQGDQIEFEETTTLRQMKNLSSSRPYKLDEILFQVFGWFCWPWKWIECQIFWQKKCRIQFMFMIWLIRNGLCHNNQRINNHFWLANLIVIYPRFYFKLKYFCRKYENMQKGKENSVAGLFQII